MGVRLSLRRREQLLGLALIAPTVIFIAAVVIYPVAATLGLSFFSENLLRPERGTQFIGIDNFARIFRDDLFWMGLKNTVVLTAAAVVGEVVLGMIVALTLNAPFRGRGVIRTLNILPWVVPSFVAAFIWIWLFHPQFGPINQFLVWSGIVDQGIPWISQGSTAMGSVIVVYIWKGLPWTFLVLLAGLQSIPEEWYEAAKVDGASPWQQFRYITLPSLRYILVIVIVLRTIWTFNNFDLVYLLTGGGPARATVTLPLNVYSTAFLQYDFGLSAAIAAFMVVVVLGLSIVVLKLSRIETET
ncbi:MAG: sugar ABC transporter permease [Chloroflexi bacterium]|nr:sugar ABC transporter permease [Chloroflexota bacterium]